MKPEGFRAIKEYQKVINLNFLKISAADRLQTIIFKISFKINRFSK
jgi:hypothetical protein